MLNENIKSSAIAPFSIYHYMTEIEKSQGS